MFRLVDHRMKTFKDILSKASRVTVANFPLFICCLILISAIQFSNTDNSKSSGYHRFSQSFHSFQKSLNYENKNPFVFQVVKPFSEENSLPSLNAEIYEFKANIDYLRRGIGLLDYRESNITEFQSQHNFTITLNQLVGNDLKSKKKVLSSSLFEANITKLLPLKSTILRI